MMLRWLWRGLLALIVVAALGVAVALWRFANYAPADPAIAPDAAAQALFIDDYAGARQAFLAEGDALAARFQRVERFAIPVASAQASGLFVDGLYVPAQQSPKRLIIMSSGVHKPYVTAH